MCWGGNIASRDEEKAEVLNAFLTSAFNRKPTYPQAIQPPEVEDRSREQNEVPTWQEEVVSELLCCLDTHKSREMPSFPHTATEGAGEAAHKAPLSLVCQQFWLTAELLGGWTLVQHDTHI